MDAGIFTAPGQLAQVPPTPPAPDPLEVVKRKMVKGDKLTPEEARLILNSGASSSDVNEVKSKPYEVGPPKAVFDASTAAKPVAFKSLPLSKRPDNIRGGTETLIPMGQTGSTADQLSVPMGGKPVQPPPLPVATPPMPVATQPIRPITNQATPVQTSPIPQGPVSSSISKSSPVASEAMTKPVEKQDVEQGLNMLQKFFSSAPDGLTLGNVLDAVGVAFSAKGGTQRQTMLQQDLAAKRQLAMQQAMNQQQFGQQKELQQAGFGQEKEMANIAMANQLQLKKQELDIERQRAQMELANAKDIATHTAALEKVNKLAEIAANMDAQLKMLAPQFAAASGGLVAKQNSWVSGVGK